MPYNCYGSEAATLIGGSDTLSKSIVTKFALQLKPKSLNQTVATFQKF